MSNKLKHVEAFCLMQYQDEKTGEIEIIWNSRDGVTPFGVTSRLGNQATHIDWKRDIFCPMYIPNVGDRVFVDLTLENAMEYRTRYVEKHWEDKMGLGEISMKDYYGFSSKEEAIRELAEADMAEGAPICVVVTEEMQKEFRQAQQDRWAIAGPLGHSMAGKRFA